MNLLERHQRSDRSTLLERDQSIDGHGRLPIHGEKVAERLPPEPTVVSRPAGSA